MWLRLSENDDSPDKAAPLFCRKRVDRGKTPGEKKLGMALDAPHSSRASARETETERETKEGRKNTLERKRHAAGCCRRQALLLPATLLMLRNSSRVGRMRPPG